MSLSDQHAYRRIIYVSEAAGDVDLRAILRQSRTNNGIDGVSGVLAYDGATFGQVLEGPPESVAEAFGRIERDPRHTELRVIDDRLVEDRLFAEWTMAGLSSDLGDVIRGRLAGLLEHASDKVRRVFLLPGSV